MSFTLTDTGTNTTITTGKKVKVRLWNPLKGNARFAHLSCAQRRDIYLSIEAMTQAYQREHEGRWPRIGDWNRLVNALSRKYGVDRWVILRVYNHLKFLRNAG